MSDQPEFERKEVEAALEKARDVAGELKLWLEQKTEGDLHIALTVLMLLLAFVMKLMKMPEKNRKELFEAVDMTVQQPFEEIDQDSHYVFNLGRRTTAVDEDPISREIEKIQFEEAAERLNLTKPNKKETIH
jgi:ABC-type oligopeptide transport system ATPase subunit